LLDTRNANPTNLKVGAVIDNAETMSISAIAKTVPVLLKQIRQKSLLRFH
jgi:hypothetical protein